MFKSNNEVLEFDKDLLNFIFLNFKWFTQKIIKLNFLKLGKIFRINEITKNYKDYNKDQELFFKSLIPNTFAANKNFLNDIFKF